MEPNSSQRRDDLSSIPDCMVLDPVMLWLSYDSSPSLHKSDQLTSNVATPIFQGKSAEQEGFAKSTHESKCGRVFFLMPIEATDMAYCIAEKWVKSSKTLSEWQAASDDFQTWSTSYPKLTVPLTDEALLMGRILCLHGEVDKTWTIEEIKNLIEIANKHLSIFESVTHICFQYGQFILPISLIYKGEHLKWRDPLSYLRNPLRIQHADHPEQEQILDSRWAFMSTTLQVLANESYSSSRIFTLPASQYEILKVCNYTFEAFKITSENLSDVCKLEKLLENYYLRDHINRYLRSTINHTSNLRLIYQLEKAINLWKAGHILDDVALLCEEEMFKIISCVYVESVLSYIFNNLPRNERPYHFNHLPIRLLSSKSNNQNLMSILIPYLELLKKNGIKFSSLRPVAFLLNYLNKKNIDLLNSSYDLIRDSHTGDNFICYSDYERDVLMVRDIMLLTGELTYQPSSLAEPSHS